MPRVKKGLTKHYRHKKVLALTKGQRASRHSLYRRAHEAMLKSRAQALIKGALPDQGSLADLLSIHAEDPFDGSCVHAPAFNYGTRSSTLIWQSDRLRWLHSEGSPCKTGYLDYSSKASEILA